MGEKSPIYIKMKSIKKYELEGETFVELKDILGLIDENSDCLNEWRISPKELKVRITG